MDAKATEKRVPFEVTNTERIPARRYYDEEFYKLECEELWPRLWQMACRLEEIPGVGDWVTYEIHDKSVIVVRTREGVKAFHNACRHRGVELVRGRGSARGRGFTCPFHGWRWNIDGENTFVFGSQLFSEENLAKADLDLVPCRLETWGGCAFINFDDSAPPLRECLGQVADTLDARHKENLKVEWWYSAVLPANWKLAIEAFMEGYHVMRTHPQLEELHLPGAREYGATGDSRRENPQTSKELIDLYVRFLRIIHEGMGGLIDRNEMALAETLKDKMEFPGTPEEAMQAFYGRLIGDISANARERGLNMPDLSEIAKSQPLAEIYYIFPHYFVLTFFNAMASYRIRPLGPERCLFEIWSLIPAPEGEERERLVAPEPMAHDSSEWPEIPGQDFSNIPLQQRGLHNQGFEYMRLARSVEGVISNYQRLIDGYLKGLDQNELAGASQKVTGCFEGPVKDIGI